MSLVIMDTSREPLRCWIRDMHVAHMQKAHVALARRRNFDPVHFEAAGGGPNRTTRESTLCPMNDSHILSAPVSTL